MNNLFYLIAVLFLLPLTIETVDIQKTIGNSSKKKTPLTPTTVTNKIHELSKNIAQNQQQEPFSCISIIASNNFSIKEQRKNTEDTQKEDDEDTEHEEEELQVITEEEKKEDDDTNDDDDDDKNKP